MLNSLKRAAALGLIAFVACSLSLSAQTLDEVLAKINDAKGGVAKIKSVNTIIRSGKAIMGGGQMKMDFSSLEQRPNKTRQDITIQGVKATPAAFDGKVAWRVMPMMGVKDPQQMSKEETEEMAEQADIDGETVDYQAKGLKLELLGKEDVEGSPAYKIKITRKNGNTATDFYDAESYLLVKRTSKTKNPQTGGELESETLFSDYRKVEGVTMSFQQESRFGGKTQMQIVTDKVELNKPLDDKMFMMPAAAPAADAKK